MTATPPQNETDKQLEKEKAEARKQERLAREAEARLKRSRFWGVLLVLLLGIGGIIALWFSFHSAQNAMLRIAVIIGVVGLYPISYLAYQAHGESRRKKIERDINLLGLVRDNEKSEIEELFKTVYSPVQYMAYIGLIVLVSLLILLAYFQREALGAFAPPEVLTLVYYGFLGAYVFSVQDLVRRYNTFDLQPQVYSSIFMRMVIAVLIILVGATVILASGGSLAAEPAQSDTTVIVSSIEGLPQVTPTAAAQVRAIPTPLGQAAAPTAIMSGAVPTAITGNGVATQAVQINGATITTTVETAPAAEPPAGDAAGWAAVLAFVIGMFPASGIRWFVTRASRVLGDQEQYRPHELQLRVLLGINEHHEARLREMGIDDAQNLATVDLRKLLLTTQFDTQTVVNWVDQAILYCKVGKKITDCRELNITTFHELRYAVSSLNPAGSVATPANDLLGRLLVKLNLNSREELVALTNYTNYPNYTHISEYYTRTARVARDISEEGEQSVFGSREENKDYGELREIDPKELARLEDIVQQAPDDEKTLVKLGTAYYYQSLKNQDKALLETANQRLEQALAIDSELVEAYYIQALVAFRLENLNTVITKCTEAIKRDNTHPTAYNLRGLTYSLLGYYDLADSDLDRAINLDRWNGEAYLNRARVANATHHFDRAIADLERANLLRVDTKELWLIWGVALLGLGKFKDAVTMFSRALRYDPGFTLALARRGYAYLNLGLAYYPQAALDLQAAVKNDATIVEAWYNLGILHTRQGNDAEVIKMLTQVLELQPDNYAAHFDLAEALLRLGNPQAAAEHFQRVLELAPAESPEFKQSQIELDKLNNNPGV
ncbi:MAG TPA: tetratricopeptide repeat protein [Anaerolineaceae bacterium]|nr:tetratricopeptide repeat protein [Anaerolineaceae bacterium]HQH86960.1 tetratricopeptide repeat protein [Anaerolineaceae bacterium]